MSDSLDDNPYDDGTRNKGCRYRDETDACLCWRKAFGSFKVDG